MDGDRQDDKDKTDKANPAAEARRRALLRLTLMRRAIDDRRNGRGTNAGTTADPLRDFWRRDG